MPEILVYTLGHSTRPLEEFLGLLQGHAVTRLIDVRKMPRSARNPQFNRETFSGALAETGISYRHTPELGGFRRARSDSPNGGWQNASFRGYADYMQTAEFKAALTSLLIEAERDRVAIMCAEAVPWRCHRRLIADALVVQGARVEEIRTPTTTEPHQLTSFAIVTDSGLTYPPGDGANFELGLDGSTDQG